MVHVISVPPAVAAPWWWVFFSKGNGGALSSNSSVERYIAQFIKSAQNQDTVYIASFTWGSGTNDPINGSGWGINNLFAARSGVPGAAPVRILADGDDLVDINATKNPAVPMVSSPPGPSHTHNKVITLGTRAVMTGSMNFTAGGYSNQPNNMLIVRVPSVARAYLNEFDDQFLNSNFVENTPSPQNLFSSPNGDRIEVFFAPDDNGSFPNGNINLSPYSAGSALKEILKYHIANTNESVYYMINQFGMTTELASALTTASSSTKIVEGWLDVDVASNLPSLQNDHTARNWGAFSNVQGHHKVMIFDMDIVATGSANHSYGSMRDSGGGANVENMILVYDFRLARKYMTEYRRSMALLAAENVGQPDSFDQTAPGAVTNLTAVDVAGTSNQLQLSWTGPNSNDLSRYFVFISPTAITSQVDIGDGIDGDGDGYIDEDPAGDADGFPSGTGALNANDDDADGVQDEDPWMYPEAQVKNQTAGAAIVTTLSTANVGGVLQDNTNYWIAVVAVDKHGNEGPVSIVGPVQSLPAAPGAQPLASVAFTPAASNIVSVASSLDVSVGNAAGAPRPITAVSINMGAAANSEVASAGQTPPANWSVNVAGSILTYTATTVPAYIDPGETLVFRIAVTNAPNTGPTTPILVSTTDNNNVTIPNLNAGFVSVVSATPPPPPGLLNNVLTISARDANNNVASVLGGAERLLKTDITVNYTIALAPTAATSIWYDVNKNPDGPGGSATDKQVVSSGSGTTFSAVIPGSTDSAMINGAQVRFLVQIDNETHTNSGNFYRFVVDNFVTVPAGLAITTTGFNDLTVSWTPIADADFLQYDIFYSTTNPPTLSDPSVTVTTQSQASVQLTALNLNTSYYIAIRARDTLGNVSGLSSSVSATTKQGTALTVQNATDGTTQISTFDGTARLTDNSITVSFTLDKAPASPSDVQLWFDVGDNPDGPGGLNGQDRQILAAGSGLSWQAVIPGNDAEIVDGALVKFVFVIAGQLLQNQGVPYRFKVIQGITSAPANLTITDTTGTGFTLTWSPISIQANFGGYRVFYATDTVTKSSSSWGSENDVALFFSSANRTTITELAPNTQYRLKIAGVDALGNVGPLSNESVGQTGTRGAVLITEVGIEENPEFVELEAMVGPIDISSFAITDLDGAPVTLAASALTLQRGQRAVVWLTAGVDETDATGDANGSGYIDIYAPGPSLAPGTDEVVLLSGTGDTVDAVVYRGSKLDNIDAVDLAALTPAHWSGTDSAGAVRAFTSVAYQRTPSIARKTRASGGLLDQNAKTDWDVVTDTTPGLLNRFMTISNVTISDTSNAGSVRTASILAGSDKLKSGPYRLTLTLSQIPAVTNGLKLWYDTNADPDGRQSPSATDAVVTAPMAAGARTVDADVTIPEAAHGKDMRFIFTAENDPTNPDANDEIRMTRGGLPYRFTVDQLGPDTPGGLRIIDKTLGSFKLIWNPVQNPGDFSNYVLYYDTGAVTTSSPAWAAAKDPALANISASSTRITGLASNVFYHFRLAAIDLVGNVSGLSDTASETTVAPVSVNGISATDGINTIGSFSGAEKLQQKTVTISVTFDRNVQNPVLYWNTITAAQADGPGGNSDSTVTLTPVTSNQYSCTLPAQSHDSTVYFVFNTDAGVIRGSSGAYAFKIDGLAADTVSSFKFGGYFDVGPNRNTSVAVTWTPILAAANADFRDYRILYQKGANVTAATANVWGPVKAPILSDIRAAGTAVQNLIANDTYTFAVQWIDRTNNISPLSDTFSVVTVNAVPFEDPASDGVNEAHVLDGTEWLMKRDITVTFIFSTSPKDASTAILKWNVGAAAGDGQSRTIPMTARPWAPLVYDGVIAAENDPIVTDGCMVRYALWADGIKFDNNGVDFKFLVDATPPVPLTGVNVVDNGSSITAVWTPVSMPDFNTYRIRYRQAGSSAWSYFDRSNKSILGNANANNLTFPVNSTAHYYVNIAAVDLAAHEAWQPVDRVIKRGAAMDPQITADGLRVMPVVAGSPAALTARIWDLNGAGWAGQTIRFTLLGDSGHFGAAGVRVKDVVSAADGTAKVTLWPLESEANYYITASSLAAIGAPTWYYVRSLPDERLRNQTKIIILDNP